MILLFGKGTGKEKEGLVKESGKRGLRNGTPATRACATEARWIFFKNEAVVTSVKCYRKVKRDY